MKTTSRFFSLWMVWLAVTTHMYAQGTVFTYQGRLNDGASGANGSYDLTFALYDASSGGAQQGNAITNTATAVSNGLFTVTLDFGNQFPGADRWLEIGVRTSGGGAFTTLNPRQAIMATPYSVYAGNAGVAASAATLSSALTEGLLPAATLRRYVNETVTGFYTFSPPTGNPPFAVNSLALVTNLNADLLDGLGASALWQLGGNAGTTPGTHFLGTTDNQPLEFGVNNQRALRLEPNASGAPNLIAGSPHNFVGAGVVGATIGGGGAANFNGFAYTNSVLATFGVVGGGLGNTIAADSFATTIAGGLFNDIGTNSYSSAIGGGDNNTIAANAARATIAGGRYNTIAANAGSATIAGGYSNDIGTNSYYSAVGGGENNIIGDNLSHATIAGGRFNDIGTNSTYSAIGGGYNNRIGADSGSAAIAGGFANTIGTHSDKSAIGGGAQNIIAADAESAYIGGGYVNTIGTHSDYSAIGGGYNNSIAADSVYATIPGGYWNTATSYAFAAGRQARANHVGAFVWADSTGGNFPSTANNQFLIRASSGVGINKNNPATALDVAGTVTATSFTGDGAGLTSLNAANLTGSVPSASLTSVPAASLTGTVADARLSASVSLLGPTIESAEITDGTVANADLSASAGIVDTKLATISAAGKVANSATTATSANTANAIVARDASGNFSAGTISATSFSGSGAELTSLNAANLTGFVPSASLTSVPAANLTGTVADARLSGNVPLLNASQTFTGVNKFNNSVGIGIAPQSTLHVNGTARIQGTDNWDVNNTEGDFRVGNDTHRFKIGLAAGGGGAGDVWMRAQGGTARVFIKTPGGTYFYSNEGQTAGVSLAPNGTAWGVISDRSVKKDVAAVDSMEILEKLAAMPITQWRYNWESEETTPHIGPMAQDFKAAFYPGTDDKSITTQEADGVALAAIQGLNQKLEEQKAENAELQRQLNELKALVKQLAEKK